MSDEDVRHGGLPDVSVDVSSDGEDRLTVVPSDAAAEGAAPVPLPPAVPAPRTGAPVHPFPLPPRPVGPPAWAVAPPPRVIDPDAPVVPLRPRPILGSAAIVAGVLLWAFVVMGTFTTSWLAGGGAPLAPGVAVTVVTATTLAAWFFVVRRSQAMPVQGVRGPVGRFIVVGFVAFALWAAIVVVATVVGRASGANVDALMGGALLVISVVAVVMGDRMLGRTRLPSTSGRRALVLAAWFCVGMITLGACVELVAES